MGAELALPDLGEGLTEAVVVRWLVDVGTEITTDQMVVEVETAKAVMEVPCPHPGTVTELCAAEGETVPVGHPLVRVAAQGANGARDGESGQVLVGYGTRVGDGRKAASTRDTPAGATISPVVRRVARMHGVDITTVRGTGPGGQITRADVLAAAGAKDGTGTSNAAPDTSTRDRPAAANRTAAVPDGPSTADTKSIADGATGSGGMVVKRAGEAAGRFSGGSWTAPQVTCWREADFTDLLAARDAAFPKDGPDPRPGVPGLLARAAMIALAGFGELNAAVDAGTGEVRVLPRCHLGMAVLSGSGLVVPVVRDAAELSGRELWAALRRMGDRVASGTLEAADLAGATFTVNNYGGLGADGATPLLAPGQAAMLGAGRIVRRPWEHRDTIALRHTGTISLTFDHRACDGGVAGRFLGAVVDVVENPSTIL